MNNNQEKPTKRTLRSYFKVPHVFALMFIIIIVAAALTYIVPAGEFNRVEDPASGRLIVEAGSFQSVEKSPVNLLGIPTAVITGLNATSDIILFIFVVGGSFRIITSTGAFDAVIRSITAKLGTREILIIPVLMTLFAICGATVGMSIEMLGLVPLVVAFARTLNYDTLTGMAIVLVGVFCGFISGLMNPFTTGVAQQIAGLPIYSGMGFRIIILITLLVIGSLYVIRYAKKVKADPSASLVYDMEQRMKEDGTSVAAAKLQLKDLFVILIFIAGIGTLIWGVITEGWYINQMAALFLSMGIISGFVAKFGANKIAEEFVEGAKAVTLGALIVGIARAIPVVLEEGYIIDSLVNGMANLIVFMPDFLKVTSIYIVQNIINFFINSGSGQAAVTMPIMIPLGDLIGITRQTTVLSFHLGDGFTNLIFPTGSTLMAYLATTGVPYDKWVRFIWPLVAIFIVIGGIFVVIAHVIQYQ